MRVISGKYRGKRLFAPEGKFVRPTTDRIKETVLIFCHQRTISKERTYWICLRVAELWA